MVWSHNDLWLLTGDHGGFIKYWQSNMNNVKMYEAHKEPVRGLRWAVNSSSSNSNWILFYFTTSLRLYLCCQFLFNAFLLLQLISYCSFLKYFTRVFEELLTIESKAIPIALIVLMQKEIPGIFFIIIEAFIVTLNESVVYVSCFIVHMASNSLFSTKFLSEIHGFIELFVTSFLMCLSSTYDNLF